CAGAASPAAPGRRTSGACAWGCSPERSTLAATAQLVGVEHLVVDAALQAGGAVEHQPFLGEAVGDVATGDQVVADVLGTGAGLDAGVGPLAAFLHAPEVAAGVVHVDVQQVPAVLVEEEGALGKGVALARLDGRLDHPDAVLL